MMATQSMAIPAAGELVAALPGSSPTQVCKFVRCFLNESLPTTISGCSLEAEEDQCHILASVFLDFVPIGVEVHCSVDNEGTTVAVFKHPSQNDIIRFNRVLDQLMTFLRKSGLQVNATNAASAGAPAQCVDDDFELTDDGDDDMPSADTEPAWSESGQRIIQADLQSSTPTLREEALRHLARWAAATTESHAAVAQCLVKSQFQSTLLAGSRASLAELYPGASALQSVSEGMSHQASEIVSNSNLFTVLDNLQLSGFPTIVANKLTSAIQSLRLWKAYSKKLGSDMPSAGTEFLSASTRCTDLEPLDDLGDDDEWETCQWDKFLDNGPKWQPHVLDDTVDKESYFRPQATSMELSSLAGHLFGVGITCSA